MAKVELKNLTKKYGEVIAVQNMNLSILWTIVFGCGQEQIIEKIDFY